MKSMSGIISICLSLFFCSFLIGWTNNLDQVTKDLQKIESVSGRFIQEKHMKILSKPFLSEGRFYFQIPDSVRWEYTSPVKSLLIMHSGTMKHYSDSHGGLKEDTSKGNLESMQYVLQEMAMWLQGRFDQSRFFTARMESGPNPRIALTPKDSSFSKMISSIDLALGQRPGEIESMVIHENENTFTSFQFKDIQLNKMINGSLFKGIE